MQGLTISEIQDLTLPRLNSLLQFFSRMRSNENNTSTTSNKSGMIAYDANIHKAMLEAQEEARKKLNDN